MFTIQLVTLDHYISRPVNELYMTKDDNVVKEWQEPVLRIFGSTPDGVKSCIHVHGVYPYLYVPFKGGENPDRDALLLGAVLDEALKQPGSKANFRFVHKVTLVSGIPLYGYHSKHRQFFKIYFYNPYHIRRASELLLSGAILGQKFQPHEAHIPYALQFMIDYNIYGMNFVSFSKIKYRRDPENPGSLAGIKEGDIFSDKVKKMTLSAVEGDAWASDIMNRREEKAVGSNPGLRAIWEEEKVRRQAQDRASQITVQESESRRRAKTTSTEIMFKERLAKKLEHVLKRVSPLQHFATICEEPDVVAKDETPMHAYPAEVPDAPEILEASALEGGIERPQPTEEVFDVSTLIDETILSRFVASQREHAGSESEEDGTEADSVLGRNHKEEEEAELEDEEGKDMTQPLDLEEPADCGPDANRNESGGTSGESEEAFWRSMAERIFQLDGALESSSESDAEAGSKSPGPENEKASGSQVSLFNAELFAFESPDSGLQFSPACSGNITSMLNEDTSCPTYSAPFETPQALWCNYSPKMDSWLAQNHETWPWSKGGTVFVDCFSEKPEGDVSSAVPADTLSESPSRTLTATEFCVDLFASNADDYFASSSVTPLCLAGSPPPASPPSSPPSTILTPASEVDSPNLNLDSVCEMSGKNWRSSTRAEEKPAQEHESLKMRESQTIVVPKSVHRKLATHEEKLMTVLERFADRNIHSESNRCLTFCLTLKQYIKDCKEIVSVDFKNLCNREMVIIEYKSHSRKSLQNKFLIKPLDKFLEKWDAAERKANEWLSKDADWPQLISGFNLSGSREKDSLHSVMDVLERQSCSTSKLKSIKNKFTVKSMKILRDDETSVSGGKDRLYNVNENVISQGKIRMKLIKPRNSEKDLFGCSQRTEAVGSKPCSAFLCGSSFKAKRNKVKKSMGGSDRRGGARTTCSDEGRQNCKKSPRGSHSKKAKKWESFSELDAKLIEEINSSFDEYFKSVVKLNHIYGKKRNFLQNVRHGGGGADESTEDEKDHEGARIKKNPNSSRVEKKCVEDILSSTGVDSVKFVSRFLSTLSGMSQSADLPPLSITISLGNPCNSAPVQVNFPPAISLAKNYSRLRHQNRRWKRKAEIDNVDGPADGSSSDDSESRGPKGRSPSQKRTKREAFYKPLNVVLHGTSSASKETEKKKKCFSFRSAKNEEAEEGNYDEDEDKEEEKEGEEVVVVKKDSLPYASRDCFHFFRKNSRHPQVFGRKRGLSKAESSNEILVRSFGRQTSDPGIGSDRCSRAMPAEENWEPDFIDDSDHEWKPAKEVGRSGQKMNVKSLFNKRVPQADIDAFTSSDDEELKRRGHSSKKDLISGKTEVVKEICRNLRKPVVVKNQVSHVSSRETHGASESPCATENTDGAFTPSPKSISASSGASTSSMYSLKRRSTSSAPSSTESQESMTAFADPSLVGWSSHLSTSLIQSQKTWQKSPFTEINLCSLITSSDRFNSEGKSEIGVPCLEGGPASLEWVFGSTILRPKRQPLTRSEVVDSFTREEISENLMEAPFYGDPRDVPRPMETGPRILKIEGRFISGLKPFRNTLDVLGIDEKRSRLLNLLKEKHETRSFFVSNKETRITPLRKPPANSNLCGWSTVKRKDECRVEQTEKLKVKIRKPLSPEQEADSEEEMELSVALSGFQHEAAKNDDSPRSLSNPESPFKESDAEKMSSKKNSSIKVKEIKRPAFQKKSLAISETAENQFLESLSPRSSSVSGRILSKGMKRNSDNSFQIRGVTLENTLGFNGSVENLQNVKLNHSHQHLTLLVVELHVQTRKDFRPDPDRDPIRALFYAVTFASPTENQETGIIAVGDRLLCGTAVSNHVVHYVPTEKDLFDKIISLVKAWDPDILTGYEIEMHSWGYLVQRGFALDMNLLCLLGRVQSEDFSSWKAESEIPGWRDEFDDVPRSIRHMKISGRIILEIWRVLRHEVALTSYTFENVMYHVSRERHSLLSYKTLSLYWEHPSRKFRHITADHYVTRVLGVIKLLDQLDFINRTSELSRLFGIQFYEVLSRGSQFRVESMMLRLAKPLNYVAASPSVAQRAEMRAPASLPLILEPESLFYTDPLVVLDFQSLYPSIIIAYNYCFSTCLGRVEKLGGREPFEFGCTQLQISPEEVKSLEEELTISPAGVAFVKSSVRKGVLPSMLEEILETRLMLKKVMKENRDNKTLQKVLYARQLGLKLIANVTYGYTAANFSGRMPCIEVGDSVVSKGRETLHRAIQLIKSTRKWGARVVYGDTDSVFVLTPGRSREEAFRIGTEIAEAVTQDNPAPVKLKLEKVYHPCILQTKKRYVGYMYESLEQEHPVLEAKGIETVRRDGCPAVVKILEKALRILFDTRDVSLVKKYTVRQFAKLFQGRINLQDMIFAKEYRGRRGYRPGACVPALHLARQWTEVDKRAEPRVKERVPYVIVNGPPGVPLIRLVRSPRELLADGSLRINAVYYITKAIIPAMQRCFSLLGADVLTWYSEVPRKYHKTHRPFYAEVHKKSTISQYFAATECVVCSNVTNAPVCPDCEAQPQILAVCCLEKVRRLERCHAAIVKICQNCCGRKTEVDCQSIDCPVLFRRNQSSRDLEQGPALREILIRYF